MSEIMQAYMKMEQDEKIERFRILNQYIKIK